MDSITLELSPQSQKLMQDCLKGASQDRRNTEITRMRISFQRRERKKIARHIIKKQSPGRPPLLCQRTHFLTLARGCERKAIKDSTPYLTFNTFTVSRRDREKDKEMLSEIHERK